jgi:hypothetical protein
MPMSVRSTLKAADHADHVVVEPAEHIGREDVLARRIVLGVAREVGIQLVQLEVSDVRLQEIPRPPKIRGRLNVGKAEGLPAGHVSERSGSGGSEAHRIDRAILELTGLATRPRHR